MLLRLCYQRDPILYAKHELHVEWWSKQQEIARALVEHGRVFVKAGNGPGKSFLAAGLVNWFYDCFRPGVCLTTAPTGQQVKDVLWKEIRVQRKGRPGLQPKAPRLEDAANHYAAGYTAESPEAFQGRHDENLFIIFDEATGIDGEFWDASNGMQPKFWLVLLNPTDTASRAYEEELKEGWHTITLNGFEHPNVIAGLEGRDPPFPQSSLTVHWVRERVKEWCSLVPPEDRRIGDIEFDGMLYRPGPLFESRVLGRWPTAGSTSVWNELLWREALISREIPNLPFALACDVARFGDDFTSIMAGHGGCAVHHETHNGWDTVQTSGRLIQLANQFGKQLNIDPKIIPIRVDDDGVGGGVTDQGKANGYRFEPCSGASKAYEADLYPNRRSEVWFVGTQMAADQRIDLSRLSDDSKHLLRKQAMAPTWKLDSQGRRVVEPKTDTKKRIGRSPDDMDAFNLLLTKTLPPSRGWIA